MPSSAPRRPAWLLPGTTIAAVLLSLTLAGACGGDEFEAGPDEAGGGSGVGGSGGEPGGGGQGGEGGAGAAGRAGQAGGVSGGSGQSGEAGVSGASGQAGAGGEGGAAGQAGAGAGAAGASGEGGEGGGAGQGGAAGQGAGGDGGAAGEASGASGASGAAGACETPVTYYADGDGDGHGAPGTEVMACAPPPGDWSTEGDDCDDTRPDVFPGQGTFFETGYPRVDAPGGVSFDYDCSGQEENPADVKQAASKCGDSGQACSNRSGYIATTRTGDGVNPICGSTSKLVCSPSGLFDCDGGVQAPLPPVRCR